MQTSIRRTFTCAAFVSVEAGFGVSFWLIVFALAILDDEDRREEQRRKRRFAPRPPAGPKPF